MQAWTIMTAIALVAAIPMALGATPEGCDENPPRDETLVHPLDSSAYIVLSDTGTFGIWRETNQFDGLQTQPCSDEGFNHYEADERADFILLS